MNAVAETFNFFELSDDVRAKLFDQWRHDKKSEPFEHINIVDEALAHLESAGIYCLEHNYDFNGNFSFDAWYSPKDKLNDYDEHRMQMTGIRALKELYHIYHNLAPKNNHYECRKSGCLARFEYSNDEQLRHYERSRKSGLQKSNAPFGIANQFIALFLAELSFILQKNRRSKDHKGITVIKTINAALTKFFEDVSQSYSSQFSVTNFEDENYGTLYLEDGTVYSKQ